MPEVLLVEGQVVQQVGEVLALLSRAHRRLAIGLRHALQALEAIGQDPDPSDVNLLVYHCLGVLLDALPRVLGRVRRRPEQADDVAEDAPDGHSFRTDGTDEAEDAFTELVVERRQSILSHSLLLLMVVQ